MEVSVGGRGGGWTRRLPFLLVFLLGLQLSSGVFGEVKVTNTTRLEQVRSFKNTTGEVCFKPLADPPDVKVALRLMVRSTATSNIFEGGNATVAQDLLMADVWGELSFQHIIEDYMHALMVEMDGNPLTFNKHRKMFYNSYSFEEVLLLVKGRVMLSECPPPDEPTTTAYATNHSTYTTYINNTTATSLEMEVAISGGSWIWTLGTAGGVPLLIILLVLVVLLVVVLVVGVCWWHKRSQKKEINKNFECTAVEYQPSADDVEDHYSYTKLTSVPEDNLPVNLNMKTFQPSSPYNKQVNTFSPNGSTNEVNTSNSFTNTTNNPNFTNSSTNQVNITPNSPISYNSNPLYKPNNSVDTAFNSLTNLTNDMTNLAYNYPENQGIPNK